MAEFTERIKTFTAGEALVAYRRVKLSASSGTQVEYSGAGEQFIGVTEAAAASGDPVAVRLWGGWTTFKMETAEALLVGAVVYGGASGKVQDTAAGPALGKALEASGASGTIIEVVQITEALVGVTELYDVNGNEVITTTATASAVNEINIANAATGDNPTISCGGEANTGITFSNNEAEEILILDSIASSVNEITIASAATGANPTIACTGEANTGITFQNSEAEEILILDSVASSVNEITIRSAATGANPIIAVTGEADRGIAFHNDQAEEMLILVSVANGVNEITITNAAAAANPKIACTGGVDTGITFQNSEGEEMLILDSVASSVNELTIASAATGVNPSITPSGETNVGLNITMKGTGDLNLTAGTGDILAKCGTVAADKISLQAYDIDGAAYKEMVKIESHATVPQITICTSATEKLGFFGATPVVRQLKASYNNWTAATDVAGALAALGLVDTA